YLRPTSFHTVKVEPNEPDESSGPPRGISRGFFRFKKVVPLDQAPVGYFFEVMSHGYGGMPEYATQIAPVDRWRIRPYLRLLQLSRNARIADLPPAVQQPVRRQLGEQP